MSSPPLECGWACDLRFMPIECKGDGMHVILVHDCVRVLVPIFLESVSVAGFEEASFCDSYSHKKQNAANNMSGLGRRSFPSQASR